MVYDGYRVRELENGSIEVEKDGMLQSPTKPVLREIALQLNISLLNTNGNPFNTRQLGSQIIKCITELRDSGAERGIQADRPTAE